MTQNVRPEGGLGRCVLGDLHSDDPETADLDPHLEEIRYIYSTNTSPSKLRSKEAMFLLHWVAANRFKFKRPPFRVLLQILDLDTIRFRLEVLFWVKLLGIVTIAFAGMCILPYAGHLVTVFPVLLLYKLDAMLTRGLWFCRLRVACIFDHMEFVEQFYSAYLETDEAFMRWMDLQWKVSHARRYEICVPFTRCELEFVQEQAQAHGGISRFLYYYQWSIIYTFRAFFRPFSVCFNCRGLDFEEMED